MDGAQKWGVSMNKQVLTLGLLWLGACGGCEPSYCKDGVLTEANVCIVGANVDAASVDTLLEHVYSVFGQRHGLDRAAFAKANKDNHYRLVLGKVPIGQRGVTYWTYDGSKTADYAAKVVELHSDIRPEMCLANTTTAHETLHMLEQFTWGSMVNHGRADLFIRIDRADNASTIENTLNRELCSELCPEACTWPLY